MTPIFHLYGLFIAIGVLIGLEAAKKAQKKLASFGTTYFKFDLEDFVPWLLLPGIIGARLYHVVDYWQYYSQNLTEIFKVWQGGLGIYGGILGGLTGLYFYVIFHKKRQLLAYILDSIAFALPISQAIGRLGNFFNQELFGLPTHLPWGIFIDINNRPVEYITTSYFHPLFAYEAFLNLILFTLMRKLLQKQRHPGFYLGVYLLGYGIIRFGMEFLRIDQWRLGFLTTAQWISLLSIMFGTYISLYKPKNG